MHQYDWQKLVFGAVVVSSIVCRFIALQARNRTDLKGMTLFHLVAPPPAKQRAKSVHGRHNGLSHCAGEISLRRVAELIVKKVQTALLSFVGATVDIRCARCRYEMMISVG